MPVFGPTRAALAAAAASVYLFVLRSKFAPYEALAELNSASELSMDLQLDAEVDEETLDLRRIPKDSFYWFRQVIAENSVP